MRLIVPSRRELRRFIVLRGLQLRALILLSGLQLWALILIGGLRLRLRNGVAGSYTLVPGLCVERLRSPSDDADQPRCASKE